MPLDDLIEKLQLARSANGNINVGISYPTSDGEGREGSDSACEWDVEVDSDSVTIKVYY